MKRGLKGGISIGADSGPPRYRHAARVKNLGGAHSTGWG